MTNIAMLARDKNLTPDMLRKLSNSDKLDVTQPEDKKLTAIAHQRLLAISIPTFFKENGNFNLGQTGHNDLGPSF